MTIETSIIATTAKPFVKKIMEDIITPKIEQLKIKYKELMIPKGEHFEEYLYRTYKKHSIINTLVFKNEQRLLKDLYVPLTLVKEDHQGTNREQIKINTYPLDLAKKYNKILITDTAGMGKSTLTKYMFLDIIDKGYGIPIYIELRRLKNGKHILYEIQEQINSITKVFDTKLLLEFIQTGGFIFFLDGYDEVSIDDRSTVTTNIQDFISKANNNVYVLTSRQEQSLSSFGDFQMFSINPLTKKEAFELLRKYDGQGNTSKKLIDELNSGQYDIIKEFLTNPLLVSLLFAAFDYKQTIPLKKHIFYRQVYDAYFDSHDLSKGGSYIHDKLSKLDTDDFERVLRCIGYKCLQYQKIEFEKDALLQIINEAKAFYSDLSFRNSNFLTDILTAVPLFCEDGQYYKWVHKSLQEYFASQFIYKDSKTSQDTILETLYNSKNLEKYINLLDLYYDIDNWGFKKNIVLPLLKSYVRFYEENIFSSDIIQQEYVEDRIGHLFLRKACVLKSNMENIPKSYEKIVERTKLFFKNEIISSVNFHTNIATANYFDPKRKLFMLLIKRQPYLFKPYNYNKHATKYLLADDAVVYINVHSGDDDCDRYLFFNHHIKQITNDEPFCYLNYYACKKEIELIEKNIKKKEEKSNLIDGL